MRRKQSTTKMILEAIENLLVHDEELTAMAEAAKKLGKPQAAEDIAKQALALLKK